MTRLVQHGEFMQNEGQAHVYIYLISEFLPHNTGIMRLLHFVVYLGEGKCMLLLI